MSPRTAAALVAALPLVLGACVGTLTSPNAPEPTSLGGASGVQGQWVQDASQVGSYAQDQRDELARLAADSPHEVVWAAVTFREPRTPADTRTLMGLAGNEPRYFEWMQTGTDLRGGSAWRDLAARAGEYAGLRVIYVRVQATAAELAEMAGSEHVWLVDAGSEQNLWDFAREAGLVAAD